MRRGWTQRFGATVVGRLPMGVALSTVAAVWLLGCVWSFTEQAAFARAKGFADPTLLPLVIDGLAASMAAVAFAASLDGRPALAARLGTALAVLASAASNGLWAAERSSAAGAGPDLPTVVIGAGIPIAANIAFEVLLAELRRQVQRRRGLAAPVPLPTLRMARLLLAPGPTFLAWRQEVLEVTASPTPPTVLDGGGATSGDGPRGPDGPGAGDVEHAPLDDAEPAVDSAVAKVAVEPERSLSSREGDDTAVGTSEAPDQPVPCDAPANTLPGGVEGTDREVTSEALPEPRLDPDLSSDPEQGPESNPKVWRLAEYLRESGLNPASVSGDDVVALGLCRSARNGRRLAGRAASLCSALAGPTPPPRPDLSGVPRLLLAGEAPTLALVAREESR